MRKSRPATIARAATPPTTPPAIAPVFVDEGLVVAVGLEGVSVIAPAGIELLLDDVEVVLVLDDMVVFAGS